jgi:exosome complex exonuclease DIS3/RRP44
VLASPEVRFHVDSETHEPLEVVVKKMRETNSMVEEFMLLANISVATRILAEFPECAILRRHPTPPIANYEALMRSVRAQVISLDRFANIITGLKKCCRALSWMCPVAKLSLRAWTRHINRTILSSTTSYAF